MSQEKRERERGSSLESKESFFLREILVKAFKSEEAFHVSHLKETTATKQLMNSQQCIAITLLNSVSSALFTMKINK